MADIIVWQTVVSKAVSQTPDAVDPTGVERGSGPRFPAGALQQPETWVA